MSLPRPIHPYYIYADLIWWDGPFKLKLSDNPEFWSSEVKFAPVVSSVYRHHTFVWETLADWHLIWDLSPQLGTNGLIRD
jgi:hypothetical protein